MHELIKKIENLEFDNCNAYQIEGVRKCKKAVIELIKKNEENIWINSLKTVFGNLNQKQIAAIK